MKVRITFRSEVFIEGKTLSEIKDKFESMPIFSADALEGGHAGYIETVSVEDADTYADIMGAYDHCGGISADDAYAGYQAYIEDYGEVPNMVSVLVYDHEEQRTYDDTIAIGCHYDEEANKVINADGSESALSDYDIAYYCDDIESFKDLVSNGNDLLEIFDINEFYKA